MKKIFLTFSLSLFCFTDAYAQTVNYCGEIRRMRTWANGSDTYGIWVEYIENPSQCPGGFYFPHSSDNKNFLFGLLLAAKASKEQVCIQTNPTADGWKIGSRCKINYAMHK